MQKSVEQFYYSNFRVKLHDLSDFSIFGKLRQGTLTLSVTRLVNLLDFGQLFKAFGNN